METAPTQESTYDEMLPDEIGYEYSPAHYLHLKDDDAISSASANGHSTRIIKRDNLYLGFEDGIDPNRVNFTVRDGIVTAVRLG